MRRPTRNSVHVTPPLEVFSQPPSPTTSYNPSPHPAPTVLPPWPKEGEATKPSPVLTCISDAYNFDDWNVAFQVDNTLYRVHKFFFRRESSVFARMFEDNLDKQPIPLPDVSCRDFDALLQFMYSAIFEPDDITMEKWIAILHLANMWSMTRIKDQAIKHLSAMEQFAPVDKIVIAAKEGVEAWFFPTYINLVEREEPLSVAEARVLICLGERRAGHVLGMDIVQLLAQARERFRSRQWMIANEIVAELFGYPTSIGTPYCSRPGTPL